MKIYSQGEAKITVRQNTEHNIAKKNSFRHFSASFLFQCKVLTADRKLFCSTNKIFSPCSGRPMTGGDRSSLTNQSAVWLSSSSSFTAPPLSSSHLLAATSWVTAGCGDNRQQGPALRGAVSPCPVSRRPWFSLVLACGTELLMLLDSMVCDVDRSQCSGLPAMEDCIVHPSMVSMIKFDC